MQESIRRDNQLIVIRNRIKEGLRFQFPLVRDRFSHRTSGVHIASSTTTAAMSQGTAKGEIRGENGKKINSGILHRL